MSVGEPQSDEDAVGDAPPPKTDLLGRLAAWVLQLPPVRWLKPILDDYDQAGGGLLAAGVAFNSLFAILPAILLVTSLLGFALNDPLRLEEVVRALASRFPPLEEFFRQALAEVSRGAVSISIIGVVGLVWGSSRFYQSLDDAIARIFRGAPRRDPIQRGIRGVLSVVLLSATVLVVVYLGQLARDLQTDAPVLSDVRQALSSTIGSAIGSIVIFSAAMGLLYRMVPTRTPSWRAIAVPAGAAGLALGLLTGLFAVVTPRLVGSLQVYGAFVAVFAAMIWLSFVAQIILVGASWVFRRSQVDGDAATA